MKIRMTDSNRQFMGTPLQIVRQIKELSFMDRDSSLKDYVAETTSRLITFAGVTIEPVGDTDEELATSFVAAMVQAKLMEEVS